MKFLVRTENHSPKTSSLCACMLCGLRAGWGTLGGIFTSYLAIDRPSAPRVQKSRVKQPCPHAPPYYGVAPHTNVAAFPVARPRSTGVMRTVLRTVV